MYWIDGSKKEATSELRKGVHVLYPRSRYFVKCIPKKFQSASLNVKFGIIIATAAEQDKLRHISVLEPELGSIVETFYYVGYIF